jgi:hypothetical protein
MAETAVGLFENLGTADSVVDALRANGLPSNGIRVLSKPSAAQGGNGSNTPSIDFASSLTKDLRSMGATDWECEAYVDGVRRGNALVFATGSHAQADTAIGVMNAYDPIELEEFSTASTAQTGIRTGAMRKREGITLKGEEAAVPEGVTLGSEKERARSEGARVFSW